MVSSFRSLAGRLNPILAPNSRSDRPVIRRSKLGPVGAVAGDGAVLAGVAEAVLLGAGAVDPAGDPERAEQLLDAEQQFLGAAAEADVAGSVRHADGAAVGVEQALEETDQCLLGRLEDRVGYALAGRAPDDTPRARTKAMKASRVTRSCTVPLAWMLGLASKPVIWCHQLPVPRHGLGPVVVAAVDRDRVLIGHAAVADQPAEVMSRTPRPTSPASDRLARRHGPGGGEGGLPGSGSARGPRGVLQRAHHRSSAVRSSACTQPRLAVQSRWPGVQRSREPSEKRSSTISLRPGDHVPRRRSGDDPLAGVVTRR